MGVEAAKKRKSGDYWHFNFACPYFDYDTIDTIGCENGVSVKIPDKREFRAFAKANCCSVEGWEKCPIAAAITAIRYTKETEKELKHGK